MVSKWLWGAAAARAAREGAAGMAARIAGLYGAQFLAIGMMMPLLPVWLHARGLDAVLIGRVLAAQSLVRVVASPLLGQVADRLGAIRPVMLGAAAASWLLLALTAWAADGALMIAAGIVASAFFFAPLVPLMETLAVRAGQRLGVAYGRLRLWGSLTFIIGSMLAGVALDIIAARHLVWLLVAAQALVMAAVLLTPARAEGSAAAGAPGNSGSDSAHWRALLSAPFMLFIVVAGLVQASHAFVYGFSALHWRQVGYSGAVVGLLWATGVVAEIILFWFSAHVQARFGPVRLLMLAAGAGLARWAGLALDPPLAALFMLQALHGLTFGAAHLGAIMYVHTRVPARLAATGQAAYAAASMGLFMTPAMALSGWLYAHHGARGWLAMAAMCAVALALGPLLRRLSPKEPDRAGA